MVRGQGSLFLATRKGVQVLGAALIAAKTPAATWWAHDSGCAWTAAWLTLRGRQFLGARELLSSSDWSGQLFWMDRHGGKRSGHRPDLVGKLGRASVPIEVELAGKSQTRLKTILRLHLDWVVAGKSCGVIYICGDEQGAHKIERTAERIGLVDTNIRIELLDTIKRQTIEADEKARAERDLAPAA